MKTLLLLPVLLFLSCFTTFSGVSKYDHRSPELILKQKRFPIKITDVKAVCVDTVYIRRESRYHALCVGCPPTYFYERDKFVYEIRLSVKLLDNHSIWNDVIGVYFEPPKGEKQAIIINKRLNPIQFDTENNFCFTVDTKSTGRSKISLMKVLGGTNELYYADKKSPLINKIFYLE